MTWRRSTNDSTFLVPLQAVIVKLFSNQSLLWAGAKLPWMNEEMNAQWDKLLKGEVSCYLSSDCIWSENGGCCAWGGGGAGPGPHVRGEDDQEASHHQVGKNFSYSRGKADVYQYLSGSEQLNNQIMKWRGSLAKAGAHIVIFSGVGWFVLNISIISCFGDTFHLFSSVTSLWLYLACRQILHSAEFVLSGKS